jgi:hypothetical protein
MHQGEQLFLVLYSLVALLTDTLDGATVLPQFETASVTVKSKKG